MVCSLVAMVDSKSHCRPAPSPDGTQSCSQVASELNRFGGPQIGDFLWLLATRDARVLFEIMKKNNKNGPAEVLKTALPAHLTLSYIPGT